MNTFWANGPKSIFRSLICVNFDVVDSRPINIAIDGYSSCGKSTLAKAIANKLGYIYIDSGAMYRAVTLYVLRKNISVFDREAIQNLLPDIHISFQADQNGILTLLNDEIVENEIRGMRVAEQVSHIAVIPAVRRAMVRQQQKMAEKKGVAMDGRDIGTVVIPDAEVKIFLSAQMEIRVHRRYLQLLEKGQQADKNAIRKNLYTRDYIDSSRSDSPLTKSTGTILMDNSYLHPQEQLEMLYALVQLRLQNSK